MKQITCDYCGKPATGAATEDFLDIELAGNDAKVRVKITAQPYGPLSEDVDLCSGCATSAVKTAIKSL